MTKISASPSAASPSSITFCRFASSADANTSAGTPPSMIAVARLAEPSVVTCTSTPGYASSKAASMSSNAPFSEVAASTVSVPSSSSSAVVVVSADCSGPSSSSPHAAASRANGSRTAKTLGRRIAGTVVNR